MAALCDCGSKKNHSVHIKALARPGYHPYRDPSKGGLKNLSAGRDEYQKSEAHKASYARAGEFCLAAQAGCPEPCLGEPTKHHVLAVSAAGNRAKAEEWPVITLCAHHNEWVEHAGRDWAKHTTFERDGREYAFRLTAADVRGLVPPYAGVTQ